MKKIFRGSVFTFGTRIFTLLINLISAILITRALGTKYLGLYALYTLIPSLIINFGTPAIGLSNVYISGKGIHSLKKVGGNSILSAAIFSIFFFILAYPLSIFQPFVQFLTSKSLTLNLFWLSLACIPFLLLNSYFLGIIRGAGHIKEFNISVASVTVINLLIVLTLLLFKLRTLEAFLIGYLIDIILASGVSLFFLNRITSFDLKPDISLIKDLTSYGSKAYFWNALTFMDRRFDLILVGILLTAVDVSYYSNALTIVEKIWFIPESIATVLFPYISASSSSPLTSSKIVGIVSRQTLALMVIIAIILGVFSPFIVGTFFGSDFLPAAHLLQLLLPGVTLLSVARLINVGFAGQGKPEMGALSALLSLCITVLLIFLLTPVYKLNGVAIASSVGYSFASIVMIVLFSRQSKLPLSDILILKGEDLALYRQKFLSYFRLRSVY